MSEKTDDTAVTALVFRAIDRVNELLPAPAALAKAPHTVLGGTGSALDSMGMVNLMAAVEDEVAEHYGRELSLVDARIGNGDDPLETVGTLIAFLASKLQPAA